MRQSRQSDSDAPERGATGTSCGAVKSKIKRSVGRPRLEWNPDTIFALGVVQATLDEIASACKVSTATVDRWSKNPDFDAALKAGKADGRLSLRRRLLTSDNPACMIFSAKNLLGWTDKQELTGKDGAPFFNVIERVIVKPPTA